MGSLYSWPSFPIIVVLAVSSLVVTARSIVLLVGFLVTVKKMTQMHRLATFRTFADAMRGMQASETIRSTDDATDMKESRVLGRRRR
jgi:hypothetical protein